MSRKESRVWQREDYLKCPPRGKGDTGEGRRKGEGESLFRYFPGPIQVLFLTLLPFSKLYIRLPNYSIFLGKVFLFEIAISGSED